MDLISYKHHVQLNGRINEALQKLSEWCRNNDMAIDTTNTNYEIFTLAHKIPHFSIQVNEDKISETQCMKYLGCYFDRKLNWNQHVEKTAHKGRKRSSRLKRPASTKWGSSRNTLNTTFKAFVKPIL